VPEADPAVELMSLVQEEYQKPTAFTSGEFAKMMNKIIMRASQMRTVMNKLGISDTDSVKTVEQHFIKLGEKSELGEGVQEEDLRLRGLQARSCVRQATSCSRDAAGCHDEPTYCKPVVERCSRAAAACGIGSLGESKKSKKIRKKGLHKAAKGKTADAKQEAIETANPTKATPETTEPAKAPKEVAEAPDAPQTDTEKTTEAAKAPSVELGEGDDLDSELTPEEAAVTDKSLEESMSLIQMIVDDEM